MHKINKIIFVSILMLCVLVINSPGIAAPKTIRIAHCEPDVNMWETPYSALTGVFKDIVERETQGRVKVEVFPAGQMGDYTALLDQVHKGMLTSAAAVGIGLFATYYPDVQALDIPYLFKTPDVALRLMESPFGVELTEDIAAKTGVRIISWIIPAMRNFSNNKREIKTVADMKGLRMRTMQIPVHIKTVESLGAAAIPISWSELYTSLQTGVVDGQDNAPYVNVTSHFDEVQKYMTLDGHFANFMTFCINDKFLNELSKEDRETVIYAGRMAQKAIIGIYTAKESLDLAHLSKKMKITVLTPAALQEFRKVAQPAVTTYLKTKITPSMVDRVLAEVKKIESGK